MSDSKNPPKEATQSDKELEQVVIDYLHRSNNAGLADKGDIRYLIDEALTKLSHLIAEETNTARIDELERACAINADIADWPMFVKRIKRLKATLKANKGKSNG